MSADHFPIPAPAATRPQDDRLPSEADGSAPQIVAGLPVWSRVRFWPVSVGGCVAVGLLLWLTTSPLTSDLRPIQNGRRFSSAERRQAETALQAAGISPVRGAGGRLNVPPDVLTAADQTLSQTASQPAEQAAQWQAASSLLDQFATGRRQEQAASAARAAQVARLLEQQPGVASAEIVWDQEPRTSRRQLPRVRATVFLKPEAGTTIGLDTVHAVRMAVAGSRAHLTAADVVVMDLQRQVTYEASQDPQTFAREAHRAELTGDYRARIETSLADLPGASVAVQVGEPAAAALELPAQFSGPLAKATHGRAQAPAANPRFASRSGPNLRLEVPATPVEPPTIASHLASRPPTHGTHPAIHLDVTVDVPADVVVARLTDTGDSPGRATVPNRDREVAVQRIREGVRERIAAALAGSPSPPAALHLTVRCNPPTSALSHLDSPTPSGVTPSWTWSKLASAADLVPAKTALVPCVVLAAILMLGRRLLSRRWHRSSNGPPTAHSLIKVGTRSEAQNHSTPRTVAPHPDSFLPGIDAADWTPFAAREPVAVVAGLLRVLSPEEVARLIEQLSPTQQSDVLALTPSAAISGHDLESLRRRLQSQVQAPRRSSPQPVAPMRQAPVRLADGFPVALGKLPANGLEDLSRIDDESLLRLVDRVPDETWSAAMMAAPRKLQRRLSRIRGDGAGVIAPHDRRPLRLREIEAAQRRILEEWRSLPAQCATDAHR